MPRYYEKEEGRSTGVEQGPAGSCPGWRWWRAVGQEGREREGGLRSHQALTGSQCSLDGLSVNQLIKSSPGCSGVWGGCSIRLDIRMFLSVMFVRVGCSIPAGVFSIPFGIIIRLVYANHLFSFWDLGMFLHTGQRVPR